MRATSNPPTPAQNADAVWDALKADHLIAASIGKSLADVFTYVFNMQSSYARRTPYTYDASLAAGATYVPVAGTVVTLAILEGCTENDFLIMHGALQAWRGNIAGSDYLLGWAGMLFCDGTEIGFKNADVGAHDLKIEGITI